MLLLAALAVTPALAGERGRAAWVADGDTFRLDDGRWVRLWGIDAPELGHGKKPDQWHADTSRRALAAMLDGRELIVEPGRPPIDRHGRLLGMVRTQADGPTVNELLVERGCAFYFPYPDHPPWLRERLLALQRKAMDQGRGFWPVVLNAPGARSPWVGNTDSGRAFPAGSAEAAGLARHRRVPLEDLEATFRAGFVPARHVTPWPEEPTGSPSR